MPALSKRAQSLGTENAFVVLAEVNALARQGKDIISFCIGQPDFPAPLHVQEAGIRAIREGKHGYTPSAGIDPLREAAAKYMAGMRGGLPIRPEDVVVGAGAKPFIAYAILSTTDHGAGDEVIYPNPGFPIYESQIIACGAKPVPVQLQGRARLRLRSGGAGKAHHAEDEAADPELPAQPDRGVAESLFAGADRENSAKASPGLGLRGRNLFAPVLLGRVLLHRAAARHVRAHHHFATAPRRPGR